MKESKEEWVSFRDGCDFVSRAEPYFCEGKNASRLERHLESLGFLVLKVDCAGVNFPLPIQIVSNTRRRRSH